MFKKILVAIDGSKPANRASNIAADLAEKYLGSILLLSVVQPRSHIRTSVSIEYLTILKTRYEKLLAASKRKLEKNKPALKVSTKLLIGRPSKKIVQMAKEEGSDLIVIGSRGLGGMSRHLLGSVSDRVANEAPCPVLIVK
jgi:nucleotide-binding universal stress UspA family protein